MREIFDRRHLGTWSWVEAKGLNSAGREYHYLNILSLACFELWRVEQAKRQRESYLVGN